MPTAMVAKTALIATENRSFNCIRQVAPVCTHLYAVHWADASLLRQMPSLLVKLFLHSSSV